ncbi:hypothetical protein EDD29_0992 [Actinocorallia herbida]|uniref:Uncharacterized protein n=1 Tax=Actinocorallia herbida TaxID=58109 RepID=A0A3N1CQ96_9ACTN|nr:hypothetical protein [Actinocorallia herbida]ROO83489.1 hypothetical protein EDD29_0992 [Actinocorallia herbida]
MLLVKENPDLVTHFCAQLGVKIPDGCAISLGSEDANDLRPVELTRDRTFVFTRPDGKVKFAVCLEVQLRKDGSREWAWPLYHARLRHDLRCPVAFIVITPDPAVANWCAAGFDLGRPGLVFRPLTCGPSGTESISTMEAAKENISLAALTAMDHGDDPANRPLLRNLCTAIDSLPDREKAARYYSLVAGSLSLFHPGCGWADHSMAAGSRNGLKR